jgi:NMD protein affecting ribosome stability and mRNA decay
MSIVHIHAPKATAKRVIAGHCPDCKKRSRFLVFHTPWYGNNQTCLRCGREWADGEWMRFPFVRGAREASIATAKMRWRRMPPVSENHFGIEPTTDHGGERD